jgi:hypothetical protein
MTIMDLKKTLLLLLLEPSEWESKKKPSDID